MDQKAGQSYTIGQLAEIVGVNVETIRYYHRIGVLPAPERAYGSIRRYTAASLRRLRFIKRAQGLGFTLEEVVALLALDSGRHCAETQSLARKKLVMVRRKLADLHAMEAVLQDFVVACDTADGEQGCPLIAALTADAA